MRRMGKMNKSNNFLTAKEASLTLGVPLSTLYRLSNQGKIKSMHIGGRWYYPEGEIERYISCQTPSYHSRVNNEPPERRSHPRMNCHLECSLFVDMPDKRKVAQGIIKNVSGSGLLITGVSIDASMEDPVCIKFLLSNEIETRGRVVRKTQDGFGIKFRNLDKGHQGEIIKYVG